MTTRRAWALIGLAVASLATTAWIGFPGALVALGALGALVGLAAIQARDTLREERLKRLEQAHADFLIAAKTDAQRTAEMWRAYQSEPR